MTDDTWQITETAFDPANNRAYEGLFTVSSGCLHLRGSLEEHLFDAPQNLEYTRRPANVTAERFLETKAKWGTYIPAVRGNHPLLNRGIVNLPFFLLLAPSVEGEKLDMEASQVEDYRRTLDLKCAVLRRSLVWPTRQGARLQVVFERFVSAARPHLCLQQLRLSADREVTVTLHAGLDADVRTSGFDPFTAVELQPVGPDGIACHVVTNTSDEVWMETQVGFALDSSDLDQFIPSPQPSPGTPAGGRSAGRGSTDWHYTLSNRTADLVSEVTIPAGGSLVIEKRTAVTSSFDQDPRPAPGAILAEAAGLTYAELLAEHTWQWQRRWQSADVVVSGDDTSQLALRASLYHLLRAHPDDGRLAIDPKGYAGDAYRGCYFWDTEMYLLPFFLYTDLERARQLVEYRIHSLPGARANAAASGYRGARYAWEADVDGTETCPNWQYRDHEVHVTADVIYGLAYYGRAATPSGALKSVSPKGRNDDHFLTGPAAPVLLEAARFWLDRLDWRKCDNYPSLLGVMGPDEYTPISNNNSFTNRMAAFTLDLAARLGEQIGASPEERRQFAAAAAGLPILRSADGRLVRQCEEFEGLAEPAFERFWRDRTRPYATQVAQEWLYRSKCLKQADVLMLMMLFAGEFSDEEVAAAWDYYLPYTTHDSSLSAGVHAIVACRLGKMDEAWAFWQRSALNDLDVTHGGAAEGVHMAGAGINWQMAVFGFAGLSSIMNQDRLALRPRLPRAWSCLAFPLLWQGAPVYVEITMSEVRVTNRSRERLEVEVNGQLKQVAPGASAVWISGETE